jgi:hypothetical protein
VKRFDQSSTAAMPSRPDPRTAETMAKAKDLISSLRAAIEESGETHYRIALEVRKTGAKLTPSQLDRFMSAERPDLRLSTAAAIAAYLGLELRPAAKR